MSSVPVIQKPFWSSFKPPLSCNLHKQSLAVRRRAASCRLRILPSKANAEKSPSLAHLGKHKGDLVHRAQQHNRRQHYQLRSTSSEEGEVTTTELVGEDAGAFDSSTQSAAKWTFFTVELGVVLAIMYAVWIAPGTGVAEDFVNVLKDLSSNSEVVMVAIFAIFALIHSGLAYLRPWGEELVGARAFRVFFAAISLPLALLAVVYFINHRYDGTALWYLRRQPGVHDLVWVLNFVSFFFLYPSTFNLLEVAAVDEPKLHLWETGVMRITRHPQAFGQALWCAAHSLWIGSSFMLTTSAALMAHHLFSCWHGDFRLRRKYGERFDAVRERTSIVPFAAILDGRQKLPQDYYKEFLRLPYLTITFVTLGAYFAHPLMQEASAWLGW